MTTKERIALIEQKIELSKQRSEAYIKFMKRELDMLQEEMTKAEELEEVRIRS